MSLLSPDLCVTFYAVLTWMFALGAGFALFGWQRKRAGWRRAVLPIFRWLVAVSLGFFAFFSFRIMIECWGY